MQANFKALQSRASESPALERYDEVARIITGSSNACAADGITWVRDLCRQLHIPPLAVYGIAEADFSSVVTKSQKASSMKGNPITLTTAELLEILHRSV
jgi:alcohol dehydrogenase class IV